MLVTFDKAQLDIISNNTNVTLDTNERIIVHCGINSVIIEYNNGNWQINTTKNITISQNLLANVFGENNHKMG